MFWWIHSSIREFFIPSVKWIPLFFFFLLVHRSCRGFFINSIIITTTITIVVVVINIITVVIVVVVVINIIIAVIVVVCESIFVSIDRWPALLLHATGNKIVGPRRFPWPFIRRTRIHFRSSNLWPRSADWQQDRGQWPPWRRVGGLDEGRARQDGDCWVWIWRVEEFLVCQDPLQQCIHQECPRISRSTFKLIYLNTLIFYVNLFILAPPSHERFKCDHEWRSEHVLIQDDSNVNK